MKEIIKEFDYYSKQELDCTPQTTLVGVVGGFKGAYSISIARFHSMDEDTVNLYLDVEASTGHLVCNSVENIFKLTNLMSTIEGGN